MKLKTLKDFGTDSHHLMSCRIYTDKELKREAIKWIKYLENRKPKRRNKTDEEWKWIYNTHWAYCNEQQKWIKHFFNITDDEINCYDGD